MYIGIDFGTCYSTVSIYVDNSQYTGVLRAKLCGPRGEATMIRYDASGEYIWGTACENNWPEFENDVIREIKTKIRSGEISLDKKVKSGEDEQTYGHYLTYFLGSLISKAIKTAKVYYGENELYNEEVEGVTVTVPCGLSANSLSGSMYRSTIQEGVAKAYKDLIDAGVLLSGLSNTPSVIEEPVAAAVSYLKSAAGRNTAIRKNNFNVLVIDLGGGTFDVTIVEYNKTSDKECFRVAKKDGELNLGGNLWDKKLLELAEKKIQSSIGSCYIGNDQEQRLQKARNLKHAKDLKENLSDYESVTFCNQGSQGRVSITRREFENCSKDLLERVKSVISRVVNDYGGISKIDKIVMVGGSCGMPQIKRGIKELYHNFNEEDISFYEASYAIANGAAYCAGMNDLYVSFDNIANANYGFDTHIDRSKELFIQNVIFKGDLFTVDKIVKRASGVYSTYNENIELQKTQGSMKFLIYESNPSEYEKYGINIKKNDEAIEYESHKGVFNYKGLSFEVFIPDEYLNESNPHADDCKVIVEMELSSDGIINLMAWEKNVNGNKGRQLVVKKSD